ncbi:uncharacterized protein LOC144643155 isoform X2 [Oculina patagonica]
MSSSGNANLRTEQLSRNRVVIQMEQEFFERVDREKRPMEDKIKDLQQEIKKLKREKSELKGTLETEKQELEDELEKMQQEMKRKLSKAREEMEKRTDVVGQHMMASRMKNVLVSSDLCQQSTQSDVRQYKDQINLMEQRNMTLQAKTERLERELRVMGDRLRTLETRNKDLEAVNREEWINRNDMSRSNLGYYGDSEMRGASDLSLGLNVGGVRSETRVFQPNLSPRLSATNGQYLVGSGQSYGDIFDRVRYTMHTTGTISDALGVPLTGSGGFNSGGFIGSTSVGRRQSEPLITGSFNQATATSLGSRNVVGSSYLGNTRFVMGTAGGNSTTEGIRSTSITGEENQQQASQT